MMCLLQVHNQTGCFHSCFEHNYLEPAMDLNGLTTDSDMCHYCMSIAGLLLRSIESFCPYNTNCMCKGMKPR